MAEILRPFLWLALIAFLMGFAGYGLMAPRDARADAGPASTPSSFPVSIDWNTAKLI